VRERKKEKEEEEKRWWKGGGGGIFAGDQDLRGETPSRRFSARWP
jgi:hypothetical protein